LAAYFACSSAFIASAGRNCAIAIGRRSPSISKPWRSTCSVPWSASVRRRRSHTTLRALAPWVCSMLAQASGCVVWIQPTTSSGNSASARS